MKKKIKISTFIYFIWILIGISIIISPSVFKNNFNIEFKNDSSHFTVKDQKLGW